ncbi:MAG: hypothetical protein JNK49_12835 [Planctomycetes bacterium]|nr:hypothetical protein [Planctomycetota bacterium]
MAAAILFATLSAAALMPQAPEPAAPQAPVVLQIGEPAPNACQATARPAACVAQLVARWPGDAAQVAAAARADAPALAHGGSDGLAFCLLVDSPPGDLPEPFASATRVVDATGELARQLGLQGGASGLTTATPARWCVLTPDGRLAYRGDFGIGLEDALAQLRAGTFDLARSQRHHEWTAGLDQLLDDHPPQQLAAQVAAALRDWPRDGALHAFRLLTAERRNAAEDELAAVLQAALAALAEAPRGLATFTDLVLRGSPAAVHHSARLAEALARTGGIGSDPVVQLAWLAALGRTGDDRATLAAASRTARLVRGHAELSLQFATVLAAAAEPTRFRDLAERSLQDAAALGAPADRLCAVRHEVLRRCARDPEAAAAVFAAYAEEQPPGTSWNDLCWSLATSPWLVGHYDQFAAAIAEHLLAQRTGLDAAEYDTAALAMFRVGRHQQAVELQELALEKGGRGNQEYERRYARYRAAVTGVTPGR